MKEKTRPLFVLCTLTAVAFLTLAVFFSCEMREDEPMTETEAESTAMAEESKAEETEKTASYPRRVAVMINNAEASLPQKGLEKADVIYECLTEGLVTRLMAVYDSPESVGEIGSVRSARDYFVSLAMGEDAILVHAGASEGAYTMMEELGIDSIDGVNMYLPDGVFFRDPERLESMSYEHTLMTTGKGIISGISFRNYRSDSEKSADRKVGEMKAEGSAKKVSFHYSNANRIDYFYDEESGKYQRSQFSGKPHIDAESGKQLAFESVIIIEAEHRDTEDKENHIEIDLVGKGRGYLLRDGGYAQVKWERTDDASSMRYTYENGDEIAFGEGNLFVNVVNKVTFEKVKIE